MQQEKETYKYKFSVIMSIYNVEKYLEEAIDSIIKQDIGFEENVQIILVNDGSPDNSEKICLKYAEKYPNNIIYVKKENGGLSSARNVGLQYRQGRYINFCDPDDKIGKNAFKEVYKFFSKNENIVSMVAIPLVFFEAKEGIHPKYKYMGKENRVINLDMEPYNFILSSASVFYKTEVFNNLTYDEQMVGDEDTKLNFKIHDKDHCFGYVCEKGVKYNYRKRNDGGSINDNSTKNIKTYTGVITLIEDVLKDEDKEHVPDFKKELIIYETRSRLKYIDKDVLKDDFEYIINKYREYIRLVGPEYIITKTRGLNNNGKIYYLREMLNEGNNLNISENGFLRYKNINILQINNLKVAIQRTYFSKKKIGFDLFFWDYGMENLKLIVKNNKGEVIEFLKETKVSSSYNIRFGSQKICDTGYYRLEIPCKKRKYSFYVVNTLTGEEYRINNIKMNPFARLALKDKNIGITYRNHIITYKRYRFIVKKDNLSQFKRNWGSFKRIRSRYNYKAWFRLVNRRKKKYILINDRPGKAGDNGEAVFKYINKEEKNLAKRTYFVIDGKTKDYKRLKRYGKVVKKDSVKHKILFINSRLIISSHMHVPFYSPFDLDDLKYYRDILSYKFLWTQHGITQNNISSAANKFCKGIDYIITATKKENEEFSKAKYFYDERNIIFSGFPRYDILSNNPKRIITIAPTWRAYLTGNITELGTHETKGGFEKSDYYKEYSAILKSEEIYNLLKENNYTLQFLLHPGMAGYEDFFAKYENERIKIIKAKDVNYQKVFEESDLMITDYSSIAFDFAYLRKPLIYFQFDKDRFFSEHYKKGYFDCEKDGFGDVICTKDGVIEKIKYYFDNNFKNEDKYIERIENTFKYHDRNNCKRIIDYLVEEKVLKR